MYIARISNKLRSLETSLRGKSQTWRMLSGATATLAIATLFTAVPAATQAAFAFPPPPDGDSICMHLNSNLCLTGEGSGAQIMTESVAETAWNWVSATGGYKIKPASNSSVCLQGFGTPSGHHVDEEPCAAGNNQQIWTISGSGSNYNIQNVDTGGYIGVFSSTVPKPVYNEAPNSGFDIGWQQ